MDNHSSIISATQRVTHNTLPPLLLPLVFHRRISPRAAFAAPKPKHGSRKTDLRWKDCPSNICVSSSALFLSLPPFPPLYVSIRVENMIFEIKWEREREREISRVSRQLVRAKNNLPLGCRPDTSEKRSTHALCKKPVSRPGPGQSCHELCNVV